MGRQNGSCALQVPKVRSGADGGVDEYAHREFLRWRHFGTLTVVGASLQKALLDQMPHQDRCQGHKSQIEQKEHRRRQSSMAKQNNRLDDRPMNDIYAVREVAKFRKVAEIAPEPKDEYHPRNPENIKDLFGDEVVEKIQHCGDAGNDSKMRLQLVKEEQQQDARGEISKLRRKLHPHFRIDAARVFSCIGAYGAIEEIKQCKTVLPEAGDAEDCCHGLPDSEAVAEVMNEGNEQIEGYLDLQRPENAVYCRVTV